jgi:asparagine synthase (glutamine-hydrolysing)
LTGIYDEPFADSSQIPTLLVSRLARQHVTVSLSGDGGDELFGGYNRYFWGADLWSKMARIPIGLRSMGSLILNGLSPQSWQRVLTFLEPALPAHLKQRHSGDKLQKLADALSARSPEDLYLKFVSHWDNPITLVLGASEPSTPITDPRFGVDSAEIAERMMLLDTITYLPDDILVKLDRASMSASLEVRTPLLDHTLFEFAWSLPHHLKIRDKQGKWILRQVAYKYVPQSLLERPKTGFAVPLDRWLRGPLRDWAESLLDESRLRTEGYLDPLPIRRKWNEHLTGRRNWQFLLWDVLMFQAWMEDSRKDRL